MKKIPYITTLTTTLLLIATLLSGCIEKTKFGPCIGLFDDKDPSLIYKPSARNIAVGVIFSEMVLPPIFVVVDQTFCPVGRR